MSPPEPDRSDAARGGDEPSSSSEAQRARGGPSLAPDERESDGGFSVDRPFRSAFERTARQVRLRLALRYVLAGAVAGLAVGMAAAAAAWGQRLGSLRPWGAALMLVGLCVGVLWARARRWSDSNVALYLDRKLDAREAVSTALELEARRGRGPDSGADDDVREAVVARALAALRTAPKRGAWPRAWRHWHALGAAALGGIVWLSLVALPPAPAPPPPPPGSDVVRIEKLAELDAVVKLADVKARDEAERQRLDDLSRRAKELQRKLAEGMPRREAQDEIAKLRQAVAAERARLGAGEERAGLESAVSKLGKVPELRDAQRALGDRDLTRFDEEMAKLANRMEAEDRERARKALEEAAEAARRQGAKDVAKALEEQQKLLEERARRAERLRELAKAFGEGLSPEAKDALRDLGEQGREEDLAELGDALGDALDQLTPEQRKKLAEKLKERASELDPDTSDAQKPDAEQLDELRKQLETEEGRKQLAEQLRRMAEEGGPESEQAERDKGLGDAERGLGEAQRKLAPVPMGAESQGGECQGGGNQPGGDKPGQSPGSGNKPGQHGQGKSGSGPSQSGSGKDNPNGTPGPSRGGGPGEHGGSTSPVKTDPLRARSSSPLNPGKPMPGTVLGRAPNPGGETANDLGTGELGSVAPAEVGAVERSEIPKEYQEQVGRYFQPD